jgi:hypothetical protein
VIAWLAQIQVISAGAYEVDELGNKLREVLKNSPLASFAFRRPATAEEAQKWEAEEVVVNPSSLDNIIAAAKSRNRERDR